MSIKSSDHVAILALYAEYNRALDAGDIEGWLATFVEDGAFHHPSRSYVGTAELREFVTTRTAKFSSNPVIDLRHWNDAIDLRDNGGRIRGSCRLLVAGVTRHTGKPEVVARGQYEDMVERVSDGWRFKERRLATP
jgi:hypothetical protein